MAHGITPERTISAAMCRSLRMASLMKRKDTYYIVFAKRVDGRFVKRRFSLGLSKKAPAEKLKREFEELYALGEIDPFGSWTPKEHLEARRRSGTGRGVTLEAVGNAFLDSRSHVTRRTRDDYEAQLRRLSEDIGRSMPLRLVTEADIRQFCFRPGLSQASKTTYLRFCKMLFKWAMAEGQLDENPAARIRYPKRQDKTGQKIIKESELYDLIAAFRKEQRAKRRAGKKRGFYPWFRPFAMMAFYAGLRRREMVELDWRHVDLAEGFIHVTNTKSGRERAVPIRRRLAPVLAAWHRLCGRPRSGPVFWQRKLDGKPLPLNGNHVSKTIKSYLREAGFPETVSLHGLRHSAVTDMLRLGMDLAEVRDFAGHRDVSTTTIYTHLNERDLKRKLDRLDDER